MRSWDVSEHAIDASTMSEHANAYPDADRRVPVRF
jgi:hypothetical protein